MTLSDSFHHVVDFVLYSNIPGAVGIVLTWLWGANPITMMWCVWLGIQICAFLVKQLRREGARRRFMKANPHDTWPGDLQ